MSHSSGGRLLAALVVAVVAIAGAFAAYSLGVSAGAASTGTVSAAPALAGWHVVGWFLFFPFGFLFFLLFIGLVLRVLFWGGRGGHYGPRHWSDGSGSRLDEWHQHAHAQGPNSPAGQPGASGSDPTAPR